MSKHEDIIKYILSLEVGTKISVRSIAGDLGVSDGTAYRAIKDCDAMGIVTTIPRVGTVRIEKVEKKSIEALTFAEVVNIVDGTLLGGKDGVHKALSKFIIGAMTMDAFMKYISPNCLVLVGNREEIQRLALMNECAVLITGGFGCSEEIKRLANEKGLPIISSTYDTFTTASMINKAMSENLIKKDIILVEDIMITEPVYLRDTDIVAHWKGLMSETKHERYPVVDNEMRVVGIITLKDMSIEAMDDDEPISKYMTKDIITVTPKTTAAYTAHIMGWEGIEMCPVVDGRKLVGVVSRHDVIKALQYISRQPQIGETIEDLVLKNFEFDNNEDKMHFWGKIIPEMLDPIGTASWSSMNMLLSTMGIMTLRQRNNINISVDSISTYFMKPVQIDSHIEIFAEVIDMGRNFCKVEITMYDNKKELAGKTLLSAKVLRK
ncbi:DRTGG domain-containing protein [Clostridium sp. SYSU_GA19001]|uniref:DRTGG domain-containing protein n=1 Tax=Clostridium caldaquaticum TaxID=2940653 RepID=UPI002076E096|nr:DRTGG domain-containing protein [Clostridium caldaquaticum]MCM8710155.1 DRTGG domain-containing protein [Clostridium caldaquaticum]